MFNLCPTFYLALGTGEGNKTHRDSPFCTLQSKGKTDNSRFTPVISATQKVEEEGLRSEASTAKVRETLYQKLKAKGLGDGAGCHMGRGQGLSTAQSPCLLCASHCQRLLRGKVPLIHRSKVVRDPPASAKALARRTS
jgi:hypothetical protein